MTDAPYTYYLKEVQRLVGFDQHEALYNIDDLLAFINTARAEVAAQGQCIRLLTPCAGQVLQLQVVTPGHGYVNPVVAISAPDAPSGDLPFPRGAQALGTVQQVGGSLSNASVTFGGAGYFQPTVTVSDSAGTGGALIATISPSNTTVFGQETYYFKNIDLTPFPGIRSILSVRSVSFVWNNWQWSRSSVSFSKYQAMIRQYVASFYAPPVWVCQFGQGVAGSLKMYPLPDQPYQMQWDCLCLPADLTDETIYEAIPEPWTKAVPFYAAHLALMSRSAEVPQMLPLAQTYFNDRTGGLFQVHMRRARAFAQPGTVSSYYGRV